MLKQFKTLAVAGLMGLTATSAQANAFDPEDAVKYRQALYQVMSAQMNVMGAMLQGRQEFSAEAVNERARNIGMAGSLLGETYFPETADVDSSRLLSRAWSDMSGFQAKGAEFGQALTALIEASSQEGFDVRQARSAIGAVQRGCRSCHDDYRAR